MKMCLLLLAVLLVGCDSDDGEGVKFLPIKPTELLYHKGDVLAFAIDSVTSGAAIVTKYSKEVDDSTHIWYDLVCTDYTSRHIPTLEEIRRHRLFGRRVASSLNPTGYYIGLDIESVRNDCLVDNASKFCLVGQLHLDTTAVKMGSQGATEDYGVFLSSCIRGKEQRKLPPDDYNKFLKSDNFRPDEYFAISNFLVK